MAVLQKKHKGETAPAAHCAAAAADVPSSPSDGHRQLSKLAPPEEGQRRSPIENHTR